MGVVSIGKTILGSLFRKPATLMYPVVPREWEERTRGAVGIDVDRCILCGACGRACPTGAISTDRKGRTWSIERMNCIQCGACIENCPPNCLEMLQQYTEPGGEKVVDSFYIEKKAPKKSAEKKPKPAKAEEPPKETPAEKSAEVFKAEAEKAEQEAEAAETPKKDIEEKATEAEAAKAPKEDAVAAEAPKEDAVAEAAEPAAEAPAMDPEIEGYVAEVRASLINDCGLTEEDADAALEKSELAKQLTAFPYLMKKMAKETAEKIKQA